MSKNGSVVYVIDDKLGGIMSMNSNLIRHRSEDGFRHDVVLLHDNRSADTQFGRKIAGADTQVTFEFNSLENIYSVLRRLRKLIPPGPGVLVSNTPLELDMLSVYDVGRTVIQIVHDEFNFGLAVKHEPIIDVFVAHSQLYYEKLRSVFPARLDSIFYLPYGITLAPTLRKPQTGPLRLVFLGRMHVAKGIFDLPVIDRLLQESGVEVKWTIIGSGPEREELAKRWGHPLHVTFCSPASNSEVLALCAQNDVFVLPTRFEGFPVSLVETMSAGLVPVVSDLPSGVPEVVSNETGFRPSIGDCAEFAAAIMELNHNRDRLEVMSRACRSTVEERFDIQNRVKDYQALFARYQELRGSRPKTIKRPSTNRLDQPWLPNFLVTTMRQSLANFRKRV